MTEYEPRGIIPTSHETESVQLLTNTQWIAKMAELLPDLSPEKMQADMAQLLEIGTLSQKTSKQNKREARIQRAALGSIPIAAVLMIVDNPIAKGVGMTLAGAAILSPAAEFAITGRRAKYTLFDQVDAWNNRGKSLLHQHRDRII